MSLLISSPKRGRNEEDGSRELWPEGNRGVFVNRLMGFCDVARAVRDISRCSAEFTDIPPGLEIVSHSAKVISLNVRGQERLLKKSNRQI